MEGRIEEQLNKIEKFRGANSTDAMKRLKLLQHALQEMRGQLGSLSLREPTLGFCAALATNSFLREIGLSEAPPERWHGLRRVTSMVGTGGDGCPTTDVFPTPATAQEEIADGRS
jgi:hypothetical protein